MPNYTVYITYTVDDSVSVEADTPEEAIAIVEGDGDFLDLIPYVQTGGFTIAWDDINVYDAVEDD